MRPHTTIIIHWDPFRVCIHNDGPMDCKDLAGFRTWLSEQCAIEQAGGQVSEAGGDSDRAT